MKIQIRILVLFLILGSAKSSQSNNFVYQSVNDTSQCIKTVQWGDTEICLPGLEGMTECTSHPIIQAKDSQTVYKANSTFAYYLSNYTYLRIDTLDKFEFDDYIRIFATEKLKNVKSVLSDLDNMSDIIKNSAIEENWDEVKQQIEAKHDNLSVGKPVIIDSYAPDKNIRTFILLFKYNKIPLNNEFIKIITTNLILVKERIIALDYCKNYDGEQSVIDAKTKNNYMALRLMEMNK